MSAISIDQQGVVQTWWEACSGQEDDGKRPTLAGFVTAKGAEKLEKLVKENGGEGLHDHILDAIHRVYGVELNAMGLDPSTDSEIQESGTPGDDGIVVSKGGITVTYKR